MANEKDLWKELDKNLKDALGDCNDLNGLFRACNEVLGSMCKIIGGRKDLDNKKPGVGVRGMKDILSGNGTKCNCDSRIKFLSEDGKSISTKVSEVNFGNFCDCLEAIYKLPRGGFLWIGSSALSKTTQRLCKDFEDKAGRLFVHSGISGQNQGQAGDNKNAGGGGQNNGNVQQPPQQQHIPVPNLVNDVQKGGAPVPPPLNLNKNAVFDPAGTAKLKLYREKFGNDCDKILAKLKELYVKKEKCNAPDTNDNKNIAIQVRAVIDEKEWGNLNKEFVASGHKVEYFGPVNIYVEEGALGTGGDYYVSSSNMKNVIDGVKLLDLFKKLKGEVEIKKLGEDDHPLAIKLKGVVKNGQGDDNKDDMKGQLQNAMKNFGDRKKSKEKLKRLLEENKNLGGELWENKEVYGEPGKWEKVDNMNMLIDKISKLERDNEKLRANNNNNKK